MPKFSIIVVHYQGAISHDIFLRGVNSILRQTFQDYEILCYHDGPLLDSSVELPIPLTCTPVRFNDWGHSLRDLGIRQATGEYIVHFNADNMLYPDALQIMHDTIERPCRIFHGDGTPADTPDMLIFPIKLMGMVTFRGQSIRVKDVEDFTICVAHPPVYRNIDCMQLVMRKELWLKEGGWYDRSEHGDGRMYEKFAQKYGYRAIGPVLGEHH
jgi:hypothetical protein